MGDTFLRTLQAVVAGSRQLEEFCHVLVASATEDVLLCVARDYGHDYKTLLTKYRDAVVARHVSGSVGERATCRGVTKTGKPCGKRAVLHGCCQQHALAMAEEEAKRRKVQAYAAVAAAAPIADRSRAAAELLCGDRLVPAARFAVRAAEDDV